ncbi:hypothetical protein N7454_005250 [Penicillium verhagenii]|nr:hypothetical protein N7454_005250 [Penicillium verhagenii]
MAEQPSQLHNVLGEGESPRPHIKADVSASTHSLQAPNAIATLPTEAPNSIRIKDSMAARHRPAKIAIPRQRLSVAPKNSGRVPRACESCRMRKTKCSGDTPTCTQCRGLRATCVYPPGLREKMMKENNDLSKKLWKCHCLLREVEPIVPGLMAEQIKNLLQDADSDYPYSTTVSEDISEDMAFHPETNQDEVQEESASSPSSIGSLEGLDEEEDDVNLTDKSRATGHIGKSSDIIWMLQLQKESEQRSGGQTWLFKPGEGYMPNDRFFPHAMNYHLDDFGIGLSEPVQMYWMPPRILADKLLETYLLEAHPYLPIINRPLFCEQYRRFFDDFALPSDNWMAILNMIFAIAANYAHLAELDWHGDQNDHLVYLTRARMLSMSGDDLFRHPDIQQVQVEGLIAFYLLSTDQINRAWRISALAIRSAVSLGINLKNSGQMVSAVSKETRNRVWWSLYIIENKLGLMTGRPTCTSVNMCSSPFPLPFEESELHEPTAAFLLNEADLREKRIDCAMASFGLQTAPLDKGGSEEDISAARSWLHSLPVNSGLYFLYSCDLTMVIQELLDQVYSAKIVHAHWRDLKIRINEIKTRVDLWFSLLPPGLDFTRLEDGDQAYSEKMRLAFQYHSARIMLGRPSLCRHKSAQKGCNEDHIFTHTMAVSTLKSAIQMASLITNGPRPSGSNAARPWLGVLHYAMQTATVILLELSFGSVHMPGEESKLLQLAKECIRWFHEASENSVASHRAWMLCDTALRQLALPTGLDISDLPLLPYHQGRDDRMDSFGFLVHRIHSDPERDFQLWNHNIEQRHTSCPYGEPIEPQLLRPANHSSPGFLPLIPSNDLANEIDEEYFAQDPISAEFMKTFFPELGSNDSWPDFDEIFHKDP